ncbi:Glyoxalase/bleomycin resistance protein/dioxygenase [Segniliparus rotundus DSM 44985]|uniref:Glyoxalase/bleomycin resistance protein/dioxygenase n=1 Tax=Segniliparus rotundus (strain ATCC BAA-972 / CDC 1076 / CIP 108378 / DSM 44985 / JCM 13578) TaxID=640132 RepID=D6Z8A7_SEGRD|nr:VOC family protein [Segniliparus rotundus]ADG98187.1 Glyoxalase/bleomycin resistance protein/dioxygenase [Segniliparus rotundus DSM 44985]
MGFARAVAHTGITVRDIDQSVDFWCSALGAQIERRFQLGGVFAAEVTGVPQARIDVAVVNLAGHRLELLQYQAPGDRSELRPRPCDIGSWHLAVEVDDVDAVSAVCASYGWAVAGSAQSLTEGPRRGTRFVYLHDADGATLELIGAPPGRPPT